MKKYKIISIRQNIKLKAIQKPSIKSSYIENNNIGVIDIDTYKSNDNTHKVDALGFKTGLDEAPYTYYIYKYKLDSNKIVLSMINELLRTKYNDIKFCSHNLGGYVIVFRLKILYDFNDRLDSI